MSDQSSGTVARLAVLFVLLALLAGGIVLARQEPDVAAAGVGAGVDAGETVPNADVISTAWYCAAGTATAAPGANGDEAIYVANLSTDSIKATVTVYPGGQDPPGSRDVRLGAYERVRVRVADIVTTPTPGVVVEVFGGPAIVEHEIRTVADVAMGPCAHEPSRRWYFAAGGTVRGSSQSLELFNPFGDDAIVDITFVTDSGVQAPQDLQGFVVGRHSKVVVPIQDLVPRQDRVATMIVARTGRIVAEETRAFDGTDGNSGVAVSLGSLDMRREWTIPFGESGTGVTSGVSIANFGLSPASVEVSVLLPGDGVLAPQVVDVPSRSVVNVDTGSRAPADDGSAVVVKAQGATPVVAEAYLFQGSGSSTRGTATAIGSVMATRRWAFAGSPARVSTAITAVNVGTAPITVELRAYTAGDPNSPKSSPAIALQPGKQARFDLDERGIANDQVLVVVANGPIVAGREIYAGAVSLAVGVPFHD